ncbi:MAG: efflux RND transporter periplasmic adaptor subunit [Phycisphaerae bacterium]|nr:efflux RND transporter periplasmic adaptor subunit [Phycisphaerae bacterium]
MLIAHAEMLQMSKSDLHLLARDAERARAASHLGANVPPPPRRWKTRVLLPVAILLATTSLFGGALSDTLWPATPVHVTPVLAKDTGQAEPVGSVVVQAPGWVEADPFPIAVPALADGVVEEVLALEGARVERGDVVARLIDDDARIAKAGAEGVLMERQATLASAKAALEAAQRNWDHPVELTRKLQTTEAALAEKQAALARWPAELAREEAHAAYLKADYERIRPLHKNGQANDIELIQARQAHEAQKAAVEVVRLQEPILQAQVRALEAETQAAREDLHLRIPDTRALAEAEAEVTRAEAGVAAAQAQLDEAALRLERMTVRSPAAGVVMTRLVEPGSKRMLNMDDPHSAQIVRLYDPQRLQVRVDIPLVDAAKVGVHQPAEIIVDVLPDRVFRGHVTRIVNEADVQKNTLQVKVAIEDPTPEIKPEMLARARFLSMATDDAETQSAARQLFAPRAAVFEAAGQSYVWLADQVADVARRQTVTVGHSVVEDWVAISEGVQPGDRLITDPPPNLADGQRIRLIEQ